MFILELTEPFGDEFFETSAARVSAAAGATETLREAVSVNSVGEKANSYEGSAW